MSKFYITTPIYYVNAAPHVGHAYTTVIADCIARYHRLKGDEVCFLTGTDEHGDKIKEAADAAGEEVLSFVDRVMHNFQDLWEQMNVSNDFFVRTTFPFHIKTVQEFIRTLSQKGDVYKEKYRGFYCVPCESFWTQAQVQEAGGCPDCKREVQELEEENYFFRLSKYQAWLQKHLQENPDFIKPKVRYNEVVSFLENNTLTDLCISRPKRRVSWGVDFPLDDGYVVYVWFDALINYVSAIGCFSDQEKFNTWWPADIHIMAKDIIRHHGVFWPIMLKALGVALPKTVFAHGWWKFEGEKMSKSRGNIVCPHDVIASVGVDAFRYFLLREVPIGLDGNFSWSAIINRVNSDLANDLGNLVYRTLNMAQKYAHGVVTPVGKEIPQEFSEAFTHMAQRYADCMDRLECSLALESIFRCVSVMNKYIEDQKPWVMWKEKKEAQIVSFLYALLEGIRIVAVYLVPFMPATAQSIWRQLGQLDAFSLEACSWGRVSQFTITKEAPLFPRIDVD